MPDIYVVGFGFSADRSRVVCTKKNRPSPIAGLMCGPGGAYEAEKDKTLSDAMKREFEEETSVDTEPEDWHYIETIIGGHGKPVAIFWAENDIFLTAKTMTDEEVFVLSCEEILGRNDTVEVFPRIVEMVINGNAPHDHPVPPVV